MRRMVFASLRGHAGRLVAGAIAIVLGVGFVAAVLVATDSARAKVTETVAVQYSKGDLVVSQTSKPDAAARIAELDGVEAATQLGTTYVRPTQPNGSAGGAQLEAVAPIPTSPELRWQRAAKGELPNAAGEIAVVAPYASDNGVGLGDVVTLRPYDGKPTRMEVVGILPGSVSVDGANLFVTEKTVAKLGGGVGGDVLVKGSLDVAAAKTAAGGGATIVSVPEMVDEIVAAYTGQVNVLGAFLLGFTAIALFVALLVVTNTFTIVLAQRAQELALFRCVGAAKGQVFRAVIAESAVVGLVASALGVLVGIGMAQAAITILGDYVPELESASITLTSTALLVPAVIGTLTTVLAALAPARRATRVPPLAALRPEVAIRVRSRAGAFRIVLGVLLLLGGGGLIAIALQSSNPELGMLMGVAGGGASFLGVLLFSPILTPAVVRLLGLAARATGVPGKVSVDNAVRNPSRTAATAGALLVGVTLISLLTVGAATTQATSERSLDEQMPIDLTFSLATALDPSGTEGSTGLPAATIDAVREAPGIETVVVEHAVQGKVDGTNLLVTGVDPAQAARAVHDSRPIDGLAPGTAVISPSMASEAGVSDGDALDIMVGSVTRTFDVHVVNEILTPNVLVTKSDLADLEAGGSRSMVTGLWAKLAQDADLPATLESLEAARERVPDAVIDGSAPMRVMYEQIIDVLLTVAVGLLAISVLIALVGVGNTLSLSVLERTRENSLLRALGLTRGQLRSTLAVEALLIAGAAVVIGLILGVVYGYLGVSTLFAAVDAVPETVLEIPWDRLGLVTVVALGAGVLASVLPARRAAKTPPAGNL